MFSIVICSLGIFPWTNSQLVSVPELLPDGFAIWDLQRTISVGSNISHGNESQHSLALLALLGCLPGPSPPPEERRLSKDQRGYRRGHGEGVDHFLTVRTLLLRHAEHREKIAHLVAMCKAEIDGHAGVLLNASHSSHLSSARGKDHLLRQRKKKDQCRP